MHPQSTTLIDIHPIQHDINKQRSLIIPKKDSTIQVIPRSKKRCRYFRSPLQNINTAFLVIYSQNIVLNDYHTFQPGSIRPQQ